MRPLLWWPNVRPFSILLPGVEGYPWLNHWGCLTQSWPSECSTIHVSHIMSCDSNFRRSNRKSKSNVQAPTHITLLEHHLIESKNWTRFPSSTPSHKYQITKILLNQTCLQKFKRHSSHDIALSRGLKISVKCPNGLEPCVYTMWINGILVSNYHWCIISEQPSLQSNIQSTRYLDAIWWRFSKAGLVIKIIDYDRLRKTIVSSSCIRQSECSCTWGRRRHSDIHHKALLVGLYHTLQKTPPQNICWKTWKMTKYRDWIMHPTYETYK